MEIFSMVLSVIAAIGGITGIISLLTLRETKRGMQIDNKQKESDNYIKLINELQEQIDKLNERIDKKDERITELEDIDANLRQELDNANTALAKATLLRCTRIACESRRPPLGYSELSPEELIAVKSEEK